MSGNPLNSAIHDDNSLPCKQYDIANEFEFIAILIANSEFMLDVLDVCRPEDLYITSLQMIYRHLAELYNKSGSYVPEQILSWLKDNPDIDKSVVKETVIASRSIITSDLKGAVARAEIIKRYSMLRAAQAAAAKLLSSTKDTIEDDIESALNGLSALSMNADKKAPMTVSEMIIDYVNRKYEKNSSKRVFSNFRMFDRKLGCMRSDFVVLAARPAVGKSAYCISLALKFAFAGYKVSFFTLEMSQEQVLDRMMSSVAQIPHYILKNDLMWQEENKAKYAEALGKSSSKVYNACKNLYVDDISGVTINEIKRKCRQMKSDVVILDYIQLVTPYNSRKNGTRSEDVSEITRQLKIMAKDLNCLVIGLSQLNRDVEKRASARPMLSDLRESGSIEQDANAIAFLSKKNPDDENSDILLEIAKNRSGECGFIVYQFDRETQTMRETDEEYSPRKQQTTPRSERRC